MIPKLQNTLYTLNMYRLCLSTNLLLRYDNGSGEVEVTTKEFSLKDEQVSLKSGCCINLSRGFLLNSLLTILWVIRVYIVWMNLISQLLSHLVGWPSCEILARCTDSWTFTYASHMAFYGCCSLKPSREINFLSNLHQLDTKLIIIKIPQNTRK